MSRYIDADALIGRWCGRCGMKCGCERDECGREIEPCIVVMAIEEAPSIDIVRCGECRRVREDGGHANCNGYLYCRKWKTLVDEDGYCSWGEREGE